MGDLRAEIWARPGAATIGKIWADPQPVSFGGTVRVSKTGDGEMTLPDTDNTRSLADLLMLTDPDTPANSKRALVRIYPEGEPSGGGGQIHEWRVSSVIPPSDDTDLLWQVSGLDPYSFLNDAQIYPYDWDGTDDFTSRFPDWIWGGRDLIGDIEATWRPHTLTVYTDATGGTFTIGVSLDGGAYQTTAALAYNATTVQIDVALTALGYLTDVAVSGEGTASNPWRIQLMAPAGTYTVIMNKGSLTGGTGYMSVEEVGERLPRGWEESKSYVSTLNHGVNSLYRLSDGGGGDPALPACDTSGFPILFNGTEPYYPGVQKVINVKAGGIYQGEVWVYAQGANADLRLVIRDLYENGIAADPGFSAGTTILANTWTKMSITDVQIPDDVSQIIFRVGHVGTGDPPSVFVACPHFTEGLAKTTIGDVWTQLYDDAVTDHAGRIVWEDESGTLPGGVFLTVDFTAAVDSAGVAWADSEVSIRGKRGWSYGRFTDEITRLGYEARVVPAASDGQWKLQIYNPGTLGTDFTGDAFVGIRVGRDVIRRALRRFMPAATVLNVEDGEQDFSQRKDANAVTALGRLERYIPARDLNTLTETGLAAVSALAKALRQGRSIQPVLLPADSDPQPLVDYTAGDTVDVDDPDEGLSVSARLAALSYAMRDGTVTYEPAISSESFVGASAVSQGVRQLLEAQDAIRREPPGDVSELELGSWEGGLPTIFVAAVDASDKSLSIADFLCDGVDDHVELAAAMTKITSLPTALARVVMSEGHFTDIDLDQIVVPMYCALDGLGENATWLQVNGTSGVAVELQYGATVKDWSFQEELSCT